MSRVSSKAEIAFARLVSERGIDVSARQVERWRQAGLIDPPTRTGLGAATGGSLSTYPESAVSQAAAVARLLDQARVRLDFVPIVLFARREPVREEAFRRAVTKVLLPILTERTGDPLDHAEAEADAALARVLLSPTGRRWRKRLKRRDESPDRLLHSVLTTVALALIGGETNFDAIGEVLDAAGAEALRTESVGEVGPIAPTAGPGDIAEHLKNLTARNMARVAASEPMPILSLYRDAFLDLHAFAFHFTRVMSRTTMARGGLGLAELAAEPSDMDTSIMALGLALLPDNLKRNLTSLVQLTSAESLRWAALDRLTLAVPAICPYIPDGALAPLEVRAAVEAYLDTNPSDKSAIHAPPFQIE